MINDDAVRGMELFWKRGVIMEVSEGEIEDPEVVAVTTKLIEVEVTESIEAGRF